MFPRFLVFLASLSLLVSSASAANLRKDSAAVLEIPVDHEKAAAVYKSFMKQVEQRNKNSDVSAEESIAAAHVNARKYVADLHKAGKLAEMKSKAATLSADMHVRNGAFVTRRRANNDCSGAVNIIEAKKIDGSCHSDGFGGSYYLSCSHEDDQGNVLMHSSYFTEEGCMNGYWGDEVVRSEPKCSFDSLSQMLYEVAPAMIAAQCAANSMDIAIQSGGIAYAYFAEGDDTCSGSPQSLFVQRYGFCELVLWHDANGPVSYEYMTLDSCASETGKAQLTTYSDSACRRPVSRGSFNVRGISDTPYGDCVHKAGGSFGQTICFPEGGLP